MCLLSLPKPTGGWETPAAAPLLLSAAGHFHAPEGGLLDQPDSAHLSAEPTGTRANPARLAEPGWNQQDAQLTQRPMGNKKYYCHKPQSLWGGVLLHSSS